MTRCCCLLLALIFALPLSVSAAPPSVDMKAALSDRLSGVARMLQAAKRNDAQALWEAKTEVEALPYPPRGDRRRARKLNTAALDLFKTGQIEPALGEFERAFEADASDQEISGNYGYVLFRARRLADAERLLRYALSLSPSRASAWVNLAEVLGMRGEAEAAAQAFVVGYCFSRNVEATRLFIEKVAAESETMALKDAVNAALPRLDAVRAGMQGIVDPLAPSAGPSRRADAQLAAASQASAPAALTTATLAVPVALPDWYQRLSERLPNPEVTRLFNAAREGSTDARTALLKLAQVGNPRAQYLVGELLGKVGPTASTEVANEWYRRSAVQGFVFAQMSLAWNQQYGLGTPVDYPLAAEGYRRAAEQGHPIAMNNLAYLYRMGLGVPVDPKQALTWYMRSAQAGFAHGIFNAGVSIEYGIGMEADPKRAFAFYLSAAAADHPRALFKVALGYEDGLGGMKDKAQAIVWYRKAARAGLEQARDALKRLGAAEE